MTKINLNDLMSLSPAGDSPKEDKVVKKRTISIPYYVVEKPEDAVAYQRVMTHIATLDGIDTPTAFARSLIERELDMGEMGKVALELEQRTNWIDSNLPDLRQQIDAYTIEAVTDENGNQNQEQLDALEADKQRAREKLNQYEAEFTARAQELVASLRSAMQEYEVRFA